MNSFTNLLQDMFIMIQITANYKSELQNNQWEDENN